jgi:enoyl-CoA hydratase/carnithine racemase
VSGEVRLERDGPVAVVTLSQPARRNAVSEAMWAAIPGVFAEAAKARAVVLRGEGSHFAAGADISEFEETYRDWVSAAAATERLAAAMEAVATCPAPVIAAIEGACVGGGCGLALACDLRFAAPDARFGITPAKLGLAYSLEDTKRLVDAVGPARAKDMLFSGRIVGAQEALGMGLVCRVVGDPLAEAHACALALSENAGGTQRIVKDFVRRISAGQARGDEATRAMVLDAAASDAFAEGRAAFLEKRKPRFPR